MLGHGGRDGESWGSADACYLGIMKVDSDRASKAAVCSSACVRHGLHGRLWGLEHAREMYGADDGEALCHVCVHVSVGKPTLLFKPHTRVPPCMPLASMHVMLMVIAPCQAARCC